MNGPEENSSLYLPRISVFREVKPTLIKLSKVVVKTQEDALVIFLKISGGGRGEGRGTIMLSSFAGQPGIHRNGERFNRFITPQKASKESSCLLEISTT